MPAMISRLLRILPLLMLSLAFAGCDLVGDLLEFGFCAIVIIVGLIIIAIWLVSRQLRGRRRGPPPPSA